MAVVAICPREMVARSRAVGTPRPMAWRRIVGLGEKSSLRWIWVGLFRLKRVRMSIPPEKAVASAVAAAAPTTPHPAPGMVKDVPNTWISRVG